MTRPGPAVTAVLLAVTGLLGVAGCSGDDSDDGSDDESGEASSTTDVSPGLTVVTTPVVTTMPTFTGDADSEFCRLVADGDDRPVLDPFSAGLSSDEVELRLRNLRNRFQAFADVAPAELDADLTAVVVALADTDASLAAHDYDFSAMAEAGVTVATFDDPVFTVVGFRLGEYRAQVCDP